MAQYGKRDQYSDAPKFVVDSSTGQTGQAQFGNTVFLADATEVGVTGGVDHVGWVRVVEGSGGRSGRTTYEVLVALNGKSVTTDATDFANTSTSDVANTSGTADDTVLPDS